MTKSPANRSLVFTLFYLPLLALRWSKHIWIHLLVLVLALWSIYLCWKYFYDVYYLYSKFHERYIKPNFPQKSFGSVEEAIDLMEQKNSAYRRHIMGRAAIHPENEAYVAASFLAPSQPTSSFIHSDKEDKGAKEAIAHITPKSWVSNWNIVALIANVFQLSGCFVFFLDPKQRISSANTFIGFGCFFAWINILRYLQYDANYFFMFSAIFRSFPTVVRYLLGSLPVFVGYALFASSVFWASHRFQSASRAMHIQFALLDGDSIYDTFADLTGIDLVMGQVYLYTFVILFICVVQNLFISIIQKIYSDDRKEEVREIIAKERAVLLAQMEGEETDKKVDEEEKAEVAPNFRTQVQDVFEMNY